MLPGWTTNWSHRWSGWSAIASGVIGLFAFVIRFSAVISRASNEPQPIWQFKFDIADAGVLLQSLLMLPVAFTLSTHGRDRHSRQNATALAVATISLCLIVLSLALGLGRVIWGAWYMVPHGVLGAWLVVVGPLAALPRGLNFLAGVAGFGLILVGTFPISYALFVDGSVIHGAGLETAPAGTEAANEAIHQILVIGTFLGVWTYAIWSLLAGRSILRRHRS